MTFFKLSKWEITQLENQCYIKQEWHSTTLISITVLEKAAKTEDYHSVHEAVLCHFKEGRKKLSFNIHTM